MINHDIRVPTNQPGFFNGSTYPGRFFSKKNLRLGNLGSHGYNTSLSCHWTNRLALDIGKNQIQVLLKSCFLVGGWVPTNPKWKIWRGCQNGWVKIFPKVRGEMFKNIWNQHLVFGLSFFSGISWNIPIRTSSITLKNRDNTPWYFSRHRKSVREKLSCFEMSSPNNLDCPP